MDIVWTPLCGMCQENHFLRGEHLFYVSWPFDLFCFPAIRQAISKALVAYYQKCMCIAQQICMVRSSCLCVNVVRCWRGLQEGNQRHLDSVWQDTACRWSKTVWAKEVWWSRSKIPLPEIIPLETRLYSTLLLYSIKSVSKQITTSHKERCVRNLMAFLQVGFVG